MLGVDRAYGAHKDAEREMFPRCVVDVNGEYDVISAMELT